MTGGVLLLLVGGLWLLDRLYPPDFSAGQSGQYAQVVVDDEGLPLRAFADTKGVWRYRVSVEDVSPLYIEALLGYEDRWFWYHPGFNPLSIARAMWQNLSNGRIVSGGSTLTMQVARLLYPHHRSFAGKVYQLFRALQLEWHLSKKEILTLYLNRAPFGGTIEGVQAASYTYLGKPAKVLSRAEAALLAVLPQAPTRLRPDLHPDRARFARDKVLTRLAQEKLWSPQQVADAMIEPVFGYRARQQMLAPLLARRLTRQYPEQAVIHTTIDRQLQWSLEDHVKDYVARLPQSTSAAVLVIENKTGAVKAYLGSSDFDDFDRFGQVDMVQASRSVGSTLKPFLFAMALDDGLIHSGSLLADVPRTWGEYRPGNFSGAFSGPVAADEALKRSLNVPFVDLLQRLGPARFVSKLKGAGLPLSIPGGKANLAVILGGVGSSLEGLVSSYAAFARGGKSLELKFIREPVAQPPNERYLISESSAWITGHVLSKIPRPGSLRIGGLTTRADGLAWKTGTSYGYRDNWAIGVSKDYTIGVWVGRPDGTPLPGLSGRQTAGPLLFAVSDHLQAKAIQPARPKGVVEVEVCWPLGLPAGKDKSLCHQKRRAWTIDGVTPPTWQSSEQSGWQSNPLTVWLNPSTGLRLNARCLSARRQKRAIALWPSVLEPWLPWRLKRAGQLPAVDPGCGQTEIGQGSTLHITGIEPGSHYRSGGNSSAHPSLKLQAVGGVGRYSWYLDGRLIEDNVGPKALSYSLDSAGEKQVLVTDEVGNIDQVRIVVE